MKRIISITILFFVVFTCHGQKRSGNLRKEQPLLKDLNAIAINDRNIVKNHPVYYNVKDFGAKGDSIAFDTEAINKAIDAASANGGGTIYFQAGKIPEFFNHASKQHNHTAR